MVPIYNHFSYNIGLVVQDLQKKLFALLSFTSQREHQDPTMPVCPPTDRELRHAPKKGKNTCEKSRKCSAETAALEFLGKNSHILIMGKIP